MKISFSDKKKLYAGRKLLYFWYKNLRGKYNLNEFLSKCVLIKENDTFVIIYKDNNIWLKK